MILSAQLKKILVALLISPAIASALGQSTQVEQPLITSADAPLYPLMARAARVSGDVLLEVTTNGKDVVKVKAKSGPAMLVVYAEQNVRSWHFNSGKPATFQTTFQFRIVGPASCNYENGQAILHLPTLISLSVNQLQTCDPSTTVSKVIGKNSKTPGK